ncbi:Ada metal-binding domain-containing protein [Vagococcus fluvialis]|uniref:Ada metal-binding domain-containing protein n=1 Tax=Vagococcus fluvialis TaxID=2738 RepID=UPI0028908ACF|nr:Ada metal-binding domain-containing protein [Vagococcus fluvialis]MDT2746161.1 Ada metal-binding domain-containing protein [Vagococcus fluvialis]
MVTEEEWQAVATNDASYDNLFRYAVKTTKIFCKPSCPSRLPKRENITIFYDLEEPEQKGKSAVDELGVKAVSKYELEITLEHPVPYFTSMLTFPTLFPLNKNYVEKQGEKYAQDSEYLIYNGVFKLANWKGSNQTWSYEKNNHFSPVTKKDFRDEKPLVNEFNPK